MPHKQFIRPDKQHYRRQNSKRNKITKRIEFLAKIRIGSQSPRSRTIKKIKHCGTQHQIERQVQSVAERHNNPQNPANEIQRSDGIRYELANHFAICLDSFLGSASL